MLTRELGFVNRDNCVYLVRFLAYCVKLSIGEELARLVLSYDEPVFLEIASIF